MQRHTFVSRLMAIAIALLLVFGVNSMFGQGTVKLKFLNIDGVTPISTGLTVSVIDSISGGGKTVLPMPFNAGTGYYEAAFANSTHIFIIVVVGATNHSVNDEWTAPGQSVLLSWDGLARINITGSPTGTDVTIGNQGQGWEGHTLLLVGPDPFGYYPPIPTLGFCEPHSPYATADTVRYTLSNVDTVQFPIRFFDPNCDTTKVGGLNFRVKWDRTDVQLDSIIPNGQPVQPAANYFDTLSGGGVTCNILYQQNTQLNYAVPLLYVRLKISTLAKTTLTIENASLRKYAPGNLTYVDYPIVGNIGITRMNPKGDFNNDGLIDVQDLGMFGLHYWAGVEGYAGSHPYDVMYDMNLRVGGSADNISDYFTDNKIDFEDLFTFALNWRRAVDNGGSLPKGNGTQNELLIDATLGSGYWRGTDYVIPVLIHNQVEDIRAMSIKLETDPVPDGFSAAGGKDLQLGNNLLMMTATLKNGVQCDWATGGENGWTGTGEVVELKFKQAVVNPKFTWKAYDSQGNMFNPTDVEDNGTVIPTTYSLEQNYPNPFNPSTTITYSIPKEGHASLKVYSLTGQEVANLLDGNQSVGIHSINFNATQLSSGVYFYRLVAGGKVITHSMMLLK